MVMMAMEGAQAKSIVINALAAVPEGLSKARLECVMAEMVEHTLHAALLELTTAGRILVFESDGRPVYRLPRRGPGQ